MTQGMGMRKKVITTVCIHIKQNCHKYVPEIRNKVLGKK